MPTPDVLHAAGPAHRRATRDAMLDRGLDAAGRRGTPPATLPPDPSDEDVHGALERLLLERGRPRRSAAGCAPAAPATTRWPRCSRLFLRDHAARRRGRRSSTSSRRWPARPSAHLGAPVMPGRTHLQHAQPVLLAHHLLAHAWPLLRDVDRLRDWDARVAATRRTAPARWPAPASASTPRRSPPTWASPARSANSIDGTAARDFVAEFAFVTAMIGVDRQPARRGGHPLVDPGVRLRHAATTPARPGRASCRRRRTPTSPSWPAARPAG